MVKQLPRWVANRSDSACAQVLRAACAFLVLGMVAPVWSQSPSVQPQAAQTSQPADDGTPSAPRFEIKSFNVSGNTLLKAGEVERIVAPFVGKDRDFADIQRALEALELAYRNIGYGAVQVTVPEQNIASGLVRLTVIEPRVVKVDIEGAVRYDAASVRRSLPALKEGEVLNSHRVARNLLLANENPARQVTVLMRAGDSDDHVNASIKVLEDKPWKLSTSLDNTGTTATGDYRVSMGFQHANVFNRDHMMSFQYITSPNHQSDVRVYGLGYKIPLYALSSSVEFVGGYSNVNSGNVQNLFTVAGSGTIAGLRYNQLLPKLGDYEQKLVLGVDYKAFQNQVITSGTSIVPDITVHPVSVTYQGTLRGEGSEAGFYATAAQNVFPGGNDGADSDFKGTFSGTPARFDSKAGYRVYRLGLNYSRLFFGDWQARAQLTGQYSEDALVPGEQFGIGGAENIRGFLEREVASDRGYRGNLEVYSPNIGAKFGWSDVQSRLLAFYDWGTVSKNSVQIGESPGQSIASIGLGVRANIGTRFVLRSDYAYVLDGGGNQNTGHQRVHFAMSLLF